MKRDYMHKEVAGESLGIYLNLNGMVKEHIISASHDLKKKEVNIHVVMS